MARPREFDRDEALTAAMRLFWAHGYAATSTEDLVAAMGISRQSLYDTFGSKRRLYLEALAAYSAGSVANLVGAARRAPSPLSGLRALLEAVTEVPEAERRLGCMGINAICEFGEADAEVTAAASPSGAALDDALRDLIGAAKARGEVSATLDEAMAADFLRCTLAGLKVSAKGGAPAPALREMAAFALNALQAP
jgi:AcrR family transcriptional regulator